MGATTPTAPCKHDAVPTEDLWFTEKKDRNTKLRVGLSVTSSRPALFAAAYRRKGRKWFQDGRVETAPEALNQVLGLISTGLRVFLEKKEEVDGRLKDMRPKKRRKTR